MKKTLLYLQSLVLTTTPILTTVSCNKTSKTTKDRLNPPSNLSKQEREIINNTSLYTKLLLLSRHENLNFNSTDLLNAVFSPKTASDSTSFARNYTVNGKTYNLNDYTETLTSEYTNLSRYKATAGDPFLASVLTGMYDDTLYQNYIKQDKNKREDIFGFFGENFDANNITPVYSLSKDANRKQLAWANFTGPLSKYIADNDIFKYQGLNFQKEDPRHFYGRFLDGVVKRSKLASELVLDKEGKPVLDKKGKETRTKIYGIKVNKANTGKDIKEEPPIFGKYQTKLFYNQVTADFAARMLEFVPFVQNFNATPTGATYGLKLLNSLFPFTDTKNDMAVVYTLFLLLETTIKWMHKFAKRHNSDIKDELYEKYTKYDKAKVIYNKANELTGSCETIVCLFGATGLFSDLDYKWFQKAQHNTNADDFKVQMVMTKKK